MTDRENAPLEDVRARIDELDNEMIELFSRRLDLVKKVAEIKRFEGLGVLNRERERTIRNQIADKLSEDKASGGQMLFNTIFDISRNFQSSRLYEKGELAALIEEGFKAAEPSLPKSAIVACQGVEGSHSQQAADRLFQSANIMYFKSFEGVFSAVEQGLCRYGVLPIENSSHGSVTEVYDLMREHNFSIVRSAKLHIKHTLLVNPGTKLEDIKAIYSHEQAIGQCSKFIESLPDVEVVLYKNTASAAKMLSESKRSDAAAIGSASNAALYDLEVLKSDIQNTENNYTRFILISKQMEIYPGANRVSMLFSVSHEPGALYETIAQFAVLGLNLTKLESRPIPGSDFEFLFYIDVEAELSDPEVVALLDRIDQRSGYFVLLGAYQEI